MAAVDTNIAMTNHSTQLDISRTFRLARDNPLRANAHEALSTRVDDNAGSMKLLFRKLEGNMTKEIKVYWDLSSLSEYLSLEWIPRGLIIKKCPTFELFDDDLKKQWTDTLSACSCGLMRIIILSKTKEIEKLQSEISVLQQKIKTSARCGEVCEFSHPNKYVNKKMDSLEKEIIAGKKEKIMQYKLDYDKNNVYIWKPRRFLGCILTL